MTPVQQLTLYLPLDRTAWLDMHADAQGGNFALFALDLSPRHAVRLVGRIMSDPCTETSFAHSLHTQKLNLFCNDSKTPRHASLTVNCVSSACLTVLTQWLLRFWTHALKWLMPLNDSCLWMSHAFKWLILRSDSCPQVYSKDTSMFKLCRSCMLYVCLSRCMHAHLASNLYSVSTSWYNMCKASRNSMAC